MNCQPNKVYHIFVPFISDREEGSSFPVCFACSPLQYLTSGGGSKAWGGVYTPGADKVKFFHDGQGFMSLRLTATEARLALMSPAPSCTPGGTPSPRTTNLITCRVHARGRHFIAKFLINSWFFDICYEVCLAVETRGCIDHLHTELNFE
jgi:hypothetical protein